MFDPHHTALAGIREDVCELQTHTEGAVGLRR